MGTHPIFESDFDCLTERKQNMTEVTEQEVTQYDRQIRLWGLEAQQRLRNAKIMVFGLGALGGEIVKNLVLAGIGEINVCDSGKVDEKTLLMTNGTDFDTIAEASKQRIQELNPRVAFKLITGALADKPADFFTPFNLVIITDHYDKDELCRVSSICRDKSVKLIIGAQFGMYGIGFNDFQSHEYVFDATDGKQVKATCDYIAFGESISAADPELRKRLKRQHFLLPLHALKAILESSNAMSDESVNKKYELSAEITENCRIQVPPVCAIIGGVLGQEAIKAIGLKEAPLDNWFLFNGDQMAGNVIRI